MPVNPTKDSISISVEIRYISHGGGIGKPDEGVQYPTPGQVSGEVERLLQVVQDKKTQFEEAVFDSIALNLQSIKVNIQKVEDPQVVASSAQRFMKELREREKYINNCMSKAKYYCGGCIEKSKSQFLKKELEEFDERLKSFNRILEEGIQYEVRREVQRLLQVVQKKKTQFNEAVFDSIELNLQSINANIQKVKEPKAIATSAHTLLEELREREKHVHNCMSKAKYCCCGSQFLEKELREFDECLKSFNSLLNTLEAEARNSTKKTQSGTGDNSQKVPAPATQEQKTELKRSNAMPRSSEKNGSAVNNAENSDYRVQGISPEVKGLNEHDPSSNTAQRKEANPQNAAHLGVSSNFTHSSNTSRSVQPSNSSHSGISPNTSRDVQPSNFTRTGISSNTSRDVKPNNFTHSSISSNKPRETNKEINSAPVAPLKPSGDRGSSATDLEKGSAKMPKLKENEPIQLQDKPALVMNLNPESFQPEIKSVQQQMKPAPALNSKKESIQLQNYPQIEAEPVQQQMKPAPGPNLKKESIQVQNYPRFEAEPVQQQMKPAPAPKSKKESIQLQNYPRFDTETVQQQTKPAPAPNSKKESIQVQDYPRFEAEPVQQQMKPAPGPNLKKESIQVPNYPRSEAEPVQQQMKPAPAPKSKKESIQLQNYPRFEAETVQQQTKAPPAPNSKKESIQVQDYPRFEAEPVQQQIKPAPGPNLKKESIQVQDNPRFEAEPVQQQIRPAPVKNLKADPPKVETEPVQLQNHSEYQGRRFQ